MANFEAFRWNFSSSTNSEIGRSDVTVYDEGLYFFSSSAKCLVLVALFAGQLVFFDRDWRGKRRKIGLFSLVVLIDK